MADLGIRRRLPDLIVEAGLIFLAVILALAADEWREERDRQNLADRALRSVVQELRSNQEELENTHERNVERLAAAQAVLAQLEAGAEPTQADIGLEVALLSTAAWQSAQMSQAVQYLDLDVMRKLSEAYEIQDLFERMQTRLVDGMADLTRVAEEDPEAAVRQSVAGVSMLLGVHESLVEVYRNTVEELTDEDAGG